MAKEMCKGELVAVYHLRCLTKYCNRYHAFPHAQACPSMHFHTHKCCMHVERDLEKVHVFKPGELHTNYENFSPSPSRPPCFLELETASFTARRAFVTETVEDILPIGGHTHNQVLTYFYSNEGNSSSFC